MPFVSKAQRDKFYKLHDEGKMPMSVIRSWEAHTKFISNLPERVKGKKNVSTRNGARVHDNS